MLQIKEKTLLKIALICALVGVIVLYIISSNIELSEETIDKINKEHIGEDIKLVGKIRDIFEAENVYFIELTQPDTMDVIVFRDEKQNISLVKGDDVEIIGEIDEYEGKIEVIGHRIRVIK